MAKAPTSPTEPFKRALAHAVRSLGETPELEVAFSGDGPALTAGRAVLPHPQRDMPPADVARIRGMADQLALRLAYHDAAQHAKNRPLAPVANAAFEAVEQARLDAIGANAMAGVRANLNAALDYAIERKGLARFERAEEAPMAEILPLMVRERLTGEAPPEAARPGWSSAGAARSRPRPAPTWTGWPPPSRTRPAMPR